MSQKQLIKDVFTEMLLILDQSLLDDVIGQTLYQTCLLDFTTKKHKPEDFCQNWNHN